MCAQIPPSEAYVTHRRGAAEKLADGRFQRLRSGVSASHVAESLQLRRAYKPEAPAKVPSLALFVVAHFDSHGVATGNSPGF